jgi:hypothetical protein
MPSMTADSAHTDEARAELHSILQSQSFVRSPGLSRLLSYLCEKVLAGESGQIKEYSVALDVFGRQDSFDQDSDSIVRVQANRLRKRLTDYYATEGKDHKLHIVIPVGTYVPVLEEHATAQAGVADVPLEKAKLSYKWRLWVLVAAWVCIITAGVFTSAVERLCAVQSNISGVPRTPPSTAVPAKANSVTTFL